MLCQAAQAVQQYRRLINPLNLLESITNMSTPLRHSSIHHSSTPQQAHKRAFRGLAAGIMLGLGVGIASAQSMTPAQFVDACRNNPGNRVDLTQQTKFQGTSFNEVYSTPSGCAVMLARGASLELDMMIMNFGGSFFVQGDTGGKVVLDKSTISAPTVDLQLTGFEGQLRINEARLSATAGILVLAFGEKAKMEINESGAWYQPRVKARGSLIISAGAFFTASVLRSGLQGTQGISIDLNGFDSSMKFERVDMLLSSGATSPGPYITGSLYITGNAAKASIEMNDVAVMEASRTVDIELAGAESKLSLNGVSSSTGGEAVFLGATGEKGEVKTENTRFYGKPSVVVVSGQSGSTVVANATSGVTGGFTATNEINISAGAGGSCNASTAYMSAPVLNICR